MIAKANNGKSEPEFYSFHKLQSKIACVGSYEEEFQEGNSVMDGIKRFGLL